MKSLHLTNFYHPTSGGIRTWYHGVLAGAAAAGWQARLVVPADHSGITDLDDHARIYSVRAPRAPFFDRRYRLLLPHRYVLPGGAVRRILLHEQPDVVEVCDKYSLPYLAGLGRRQWIRGLRRPLLIGFSMERLDDNLAAFVTARDGGGGPLARHYLGHVYLPMFDVHFAVSDYVAEELRAALVARHQRRILVQPVGVASRRFGPEQRSPALREELLRATGGGPGTVLLLYAGRLSPEKNIDLLPAMMAELAQGPGDYRLIVAGSGPLSERLAQDARRLGRGRIVVRAHVQDPGDLAALFASCDVFVHPNPREPFGIAPLEAMASGCALVVPDRGGVLTYADDTNAWLATPTASAFAAAVRAAATDDATRRQRIARARQTACAFDMSRVVAALFARYATLRAMSKSDT